MLMVHQVGNVISVSQGKKSSMCHSYNFSISLGLCQNKNILKIYIYRRGENRWGSGLKTDHKLITVSG